jgi:hypothetical protein
VRPDELERRLQERLDALGPAPRAELLHVLMLPDFERADRIGELWGYPETRSFDFCRADRIGELYGNPETRTFAELLINTEEEPCLAPSSSWNASGHLGHRLGDHARGHHAGAALEALREP